MRHRCHVWKEFPVETHPVSLQPEIKTVFVSSNISLNTKEYVEGSTPQIYVVSLYSHCRSTVRPGDDMHVPQPYATYVKKATPTNLGDPEPDVFVPQDRRGKP